MDRYFVYILASKLNGTLYVGVTNNLNRRIAAHKAKRFPVFHALTAWTDWYMSRNIPRYSKQERASAR